MKLTQSQKLTVFLKCAELIFNKGKYHETGANLTGLEHNDMEFAKNLAFCSYATKLASEMIYQIEESLP